MTYNVLYCARLLGKRLSTSDERVRVKERKRRERERKREKKRESERDWDFSDIIYEILLNKI